MNRIETGTTRMGMTDAGREVVRPLVLQSWEAFLGIAREVDLAAPTRLPGWRAQEVCVHLGVWPDYQAFAGLVAAARAGATGKAPDVDAANAYVTGRHRDASRDEVLAALERHRDEIAEYLAEPGPDEDTSGAGVGGHPDAGPGGAGLDRAFTLSPVGRLPLLSVVLGEAYELAVHGLDLAATGAPAPPGHVLQAGIAALADVTGALAAQVGLDAGAALHTPDGGWAFRSSSPSSSSSVSSASGATSDPAAGTTDGGWVVERIDGHRPRGAAVSAAADVLLDASAGRTNPVALLARRRLTLHGVPDLMRLAPIVDVAPNIPGGPVLRLAARSVAGVAGLAGRVPWVRRGGL